MKVRCIFSTGRRLHVCLTLSLLIDETDIWGKTKLDPDEPRLFLLPLKSLPEPLRVMLIIAISNLNCVYIYIKKFFGSDK